MPKPDATTPLRDLIRSWIAEREYVQRVAAQKLGLPIKTLESILSGNGTGAIVEGPVRAAIRFERRVVELEADVARLRSGRD